MAGRPGPPCGERDHLGRKFGADFEEKAPAFDDVRACGARGGRNEPVVVPELEAATAPPVREFPTVQERNT